MNKTIIAGVFALVGLTISTSSALAYQVNTGRIVDESNNTVHIDGVNWSGFQDSGMFVDELYSAIPLYPIAKQSQTSVTVGVMDLLKNPEKFPSETGVNASNSVSFKTIRIPINPNNLRDARPNTHFRLDLSDPKNPSAGNGVFCKTWGNDACSQPLSVTESLYQLIAEFKKNNIRVLVDFHQTPSGRNGNVVMDNYSLSNYQNDVAELAKQIKERNLDNVIGIDVFNEPHNLRWFEKNGNQPAWFEVISAAAKAVYDNNPNLMLFVEGPTPSDTGPDICIAEGQIPANTPGENPAYNVDRNHCGNGINRIRFESNWGENFRPLLYSVDAGRGRPQLSDELRNHLLKIQDYKVVNWLLGILTDPSHKGAHIVFSPHVYGKHVATWQSSPEVSPHRFNWNFGFLQDANYPVVIGESGYFHTKPEDVSFFQNSVAPYLINKGINHQLFFWTFNTNSGDTGGVRADQGTTKLIVEKETALHNLFYAR